MEELLPRDCAYHDRCEGIHDASGHPLVEVGTLAHGDVVEYSSAGRVTVEHVAYGAGTSEGRVRLTYVEHRNPTVTEAVWLDGHSVVARIPQP